MDPKDRVGSLLAGKYRLESLLGTGGMGTVYEGLHEGVGKRFAIKVLRSEAFHDEPTRARFRKEAQAAAKIEHPNVVAVFDVGETDDAAPFMVMELLRGQSLFEALEAGRMAPEQAVDVAIEMLSALDCAHKAGIVHRDIKPANVFLTKAADGTNHVKVLDFGVAKFAETDEASLTQSGAIVGTPLYMAPEQFLAEKEVDGRADVWAVGATLFQMLTDRPVHLTTSATAAAAKVVSERAPRVKSLREEIPEDLDAIVARALEIKKDDRFASAREMMEALDRHRMGVEVTLPGAPSTPPNASSRRSGSRVSSPGRESSPQGRISNPSSSPSSRETLPSSPTSRSGDERAPSAFGRHALIGLGSGALGALVTVVVVLRASPPPAVPPPGTVPPLPTAPDVYRPPPKPEPSVELEPKPSASAPPSAPPKVVPQPPASASGAASAKVKCEAGQVESLGHCCAKGLVWQGGRCERPLATDF
ncbi:MAG: serine/threonine-protein kinase [Polyangiaceae bacterium]